jgi:two-component system, OmpR family, sensor kinase
MHRLGLRGRLLSSYLVVIVAMLITILLALVILFSLRPAPPDPTYQRLAAILRGLGPAVLNENVFSRVQGEGAAGAPSIDAMAGSLREAVDLIANQSQVRALFVVQVAGEQVLVHDSAGRFDARDTLSFTLDDSFMDGTLGRSIGPRSQQLYGTFLDGDETWVFAGITRATPAILSERIEGLTLVLAEPLATGTWVQLLTGVLRLFAVPLLQASCIGIGVGGALAFAITRSITHPLQALSAAAARVARGQETGQVAVAGPPEIRQVAESFNEMAAEVRATQAAQRDFLANVTHDLKTPLTSIQGYSQAIVDGTATRPQEAAAIIHDEANRLNRMVIEVTDLLRMQSGAFRIHMTTLRLDTLLDQLCDRLAVVAEGKHIALTRSIPVLPAIAGDGDRLAQVYTNLIGNSIKYTQAGGAIQVLAHTEDGGISVSVRDTGAGIAQEDLGRIFERFYQTDKARGPMRGTGLGLAISGEIVRAHGGRIEASSPGKDQGATFRVWLPYLDTAELHER